jgi:polar amino acid transport system substrate-binding protein
MKGRGIMKKALSLIIASVLGFTLLTGCGSSASKPSETASGSAGAAQSAASSGAAGAASSGEKAETASVKTVEDGVLTMATNAYFPPYEYYDGDKVVGIDPDIAQAIADKLGLKLKIEDMEFDSIITAVQTGKADIGLAGMTVTPDRLKNINFSDSYAEGVQLIIVKDDSDITKPDDLKGKKIGVQLSTTGDIYASQDYGDDNVEKYNKGADAVMALIQGKVDAVIIDREPAKSYVAANKGLKLLDTSYVTENYAACISKDNEDLLNAVNGALKELKEDGTIQSILDKYINSK